MTDQTWTALGAVDPLALVDARLQAHQGLQWLARAAYANVEPMPGDSHANLGWSDVYDALMTRPMRNDVALGLRLRDLTLFVERDGAVTTAFGLDTAQNEDAGHWIGEELGRLGLTVPDPGLPYGDDLPARVTGLEGTYNVADIKPHLSELSQWFANAARAAAGDP